MARKLVDQVALAAGEDIERAFARRSFGAFRHHLQILGEAGPQLMEDWAFFDNPIFEPTGWTLPQILTAGHSAVILKGRQIGVSWYIGGYILWNVLYGQPGAIYQEFSQNEREAKKLYGKQRYMYDHLPGHIQVAPQRPPTQLDLNIKGGGEINVFPSTEDAGRGDTTKIALWDEAAKHNYAKETYAAVEPQAEQLFQVSTSSGGQIPENAEQITDIGDFFANRYWAARYGLIPGTHGIMYPWWVRPRRYDREAGKWIGIHLQPHADCGGLRRRGDGSMETWEDRPCVAPGYEEHGCLGFAINWDWWEGRKKGYIGAEYEFLQEFPKTAVDAFVGGNNTLWYPEYVDGTMATDPHDPPFRWSQARIRLFGIDYGAGGGDPTAVCPYGVSGTGHLHQFGELYRKDAVGLDEIVAYVLQLHAIAPVFAVCPDPSEGAMNYSLAQKLAPHGIYVERKVDNDRSLWTLLTEKLKANKFTIDRRCRHSRHEFVVYKRRLQRNPNTGDKYVANRTVDQHGDAMDTRRYVLAFLRKMETSPGVHVGTLDGHPLATEAV